MPLSRLQLLGVLRTKGGGAKLKEAGPDRGVAREGGWTGQGYGYKEGREYKFKAFSLCELLSLTLTLSHSLISTSLGHGQVGITAGLAGADDLVKQRSLKVLQLQIHNITHECAVRAKW